MAKIVKPPKIIKPLPLSDAAILAKMKIDAPWLYATYTNPVFTAAQKEVFMGWARAAASGNPVTAQQMAAQTYDWPQTQLWNANQQKMFQESFNNPGQYKSDLADAQTGVDQIIKTKGLNVDSDTRDKAVNQVLLQGMKFDDPRVLQLLTNTYKYNTDTAPTGEVAKTTNDFLAIANEYGVTLPSDPAKMTDFVKGAIGPNGTEEAFTAYAKQQAQLNFPWMTQAIQNGATVKGYLSQYTGNIASTLGISPESINWSDPKWKAVVAKVGPDGVAVPQTLDQALTTVKTDPYFGYDKTPTAKNDAYDTLNGIGQMFGKQG